MKIWLLVGYFLLVSPFISLAQEPVETAPEKTTGQEPEKKSQFDEVTDEAKKGLKKTGDFISDTADKATKAITKVTADTRDRRRKSAYYALASYSPIDVLIPSKLGLTIGMVHSDNRTSEFEFLTGSIKVPGFEKFGGMSEQRLSILARSYMDTNSFNILYGLNYNSFSAKVGNEEVSRVPGCNCPQLDLISADTAGLTIGVGNRWVLDHNITIGMDWITWAQPLWTMKEHNQFSTYATNESDKNGVNDAMKIIKFAPRLSLLKFQIGISF